MIIVQAKNILEMLEQHENIDKVQPQLLYKLVDKVITDAKLAGKDIQGGSSSRFLERFKIDVLISQLLIHIPKE